MNSGGSKWAEQALGGPIIYKNKHNNWRSQWFLDTELPDGSVSKVILRGYRNPGYFATDTAGVRKLLAEEAAVHDRRADQRLHRCGSAAGRHSEGAMAAG